jgi:hypothetical protein
MEFGGPRLPLDRSFANANQEIPAVAERDEQQNDRDHPRNGERRPVGSSSEKRAGHDDSYVPECTQAEPQDEEDRL